MVRKLCFVLSAVALLMSTVLVAGCSLTPDREINLKYSFFAEPLHGEKLKNVVLYLPFPSREGKIINKAFKETEERYLKYGSNTMDKTTFDKVSTKYGPMLRIQASVLGKGVGSGCDVSIRESLPFREYYLWQSTGNHRHRYMYSPRHVIKRRGEQRYAHTMIYVDGADGNGLKLEMRYDIRDRTPAPFPFIFSHGGGGGLLAFFGTRELPDPMPGSAGIPIEITKLGWQKIPVTEYE